MIIISRMIFMLYNLHFEVEIQIWGGTFTPLSRHPSFRGVWQSLTSRELLCSQHRQTCWVTGHRLHRGFQADKKQMFWQEVLTKHLDLSYDGYWPQDWTKPFFWKRPEWTTLALGKLFEEKPNTSYHIFSVLEVCVICLHIYTIVHWNNCLLLIDLFIDRCLFSCFLSFILFNCRVM